MASTEDEKKPAAKTQGRSAQTTQSEPAKRYIYVGPTLLEGLKTATVFKGGIPKKYEDRFEANPEFKALFVPSGEYVAVKDDASITGTVLNSAYRTIKEKGVL